MLQNYGKYLLETELMINFVAITLFWVYKLRVRSKMPKMTNKTRKNVKCNYLIRKYSSEKIKRFTNMSLSDINDRLMDGLGVITRKDSQVLDEAKSLMKLLRKINFPDSLNHEFHGFLLERQEAYRLALKSLIYTIELGSKPVYYADLANKKYANELRALNTSIRHDALQAVFVLRVCNLYVKGTRGYYTYFDTIKDYKKRAKKLYGLRSKGRDLLYEELDFNDIPDQEIIDEAFELTKEYYSIPATEIEIEPGHYKNGKYIPPAVFVDDGWYKMKEAGSIPFDRRYNIMTNHNKLSNDTFRENIEFIADIPVITEGRSEQMVNQLKLNRKLIENFMKEKEVIKLENKKTLSRAGRRLINFYIGKWMKDFIIPEL